MSHAYSHGSRAVFVALVVNVVILAAKWTSFALTGSAAFFGESLHSTADTLNPLFLWIGEKRGRRPAHDLHPRGHGRERFFWSLCAAITMLVVGSFGTAWHAVETLLSGEAPRLSEISLAIMALALVGEAYSFVAALRELRGEGVAIGQALKSRNTAVLGVLFENAVDTLSILVALAGYGLALITGSALWDAIFSLGIAAIIFASSILLIIRNRSLIVGESAGEAVESRIRAFLGTRPSVSEVLSVTTLVIEPEGIECVAVIRWNADWFLHAWCNSLWRDLNHPPEGSVHAVGLLAKESQAIAADLKKALPEIAVVRLEYAN